MIRPQSAPAVRHDINIGAKGVAGGAGGYVSRLRVRREEGDGSEVEEEEGDEGGMPDAPSDRVGYDGGHQGRDHAQHQERMAWGGGGGRMSRPNDSGQRRLHRGEVQLTDEDDGDEEELDTKGILMQQTEVLTAELERSKARERELSERLARIETR